ncbi:hypothetical protein HDU85_003941 [Gaertneriomyces sp. JEL0708]|nr:hypothetical protein HDU85_003941 [Gaertneriomyces sp. JEL0708]
MELPDIGRHCQKNGCNQLDFLPYTCPHCSKTFCQSHYKPTLANPPSSDYHHCPTLPADRRTLTCPLCSQIIPPGSSPSLSPDDIIDRHIAAGCPDESISAKRGRAFNGCGVKGCTKKEVVPIKCARCEVNFCIRHRLEVDHKCPGPKKAPPKPASTPVNKAGFAALKRFNIGGASSSSGATKTGPGSPTKAAPRRDSKASKGSGKKKGKDACTVQ